MPWDTSSIEEAKLENWDETKEKTSWEARTSSVLLWKKLKLIQLRTFSSHKIALWSSSEWTCNRQFPYGRHTGVTYSYRTCSSLQPLARPIPGIRGSPETLRTLFTEAENLVSSRPLTIGNYQIQIRMNQSLRTASLHLKPKLYYHLLATSRVQIYTQESGSTEYITCQISFGVDGKESIACWNVRNGTKPVLTVKLVMSFWSVERLALDTSGHSQTSQRIYT